MDILLTESVNYPGHFHVPSLDHLVIGRNGVVIDTQKQVCPLPTMSAGYLIVYVDKLTHFIHRLIALTFLPKPDLPVSELDVNHLDGDKLNNAPPNLEWATRSDNCLHAYQTGLRDDNTPILVKDLRDGKISRYYSLQECARAFEVRPSRVHQFMQPHNRENVIMDYFVFIYEDDPWPLLTKEDIGKYRNGTSKDLVAICQTTGKKIVFGSQGVAAKTLGLKASMIGCHLRDDVSVPYENWIFRYLDDPSLSKEAIRTKRSPNQGGARRLPAPIRVTSPNGEVTEWGSTELFGRSVGVTKNTIQAGANRNNGIWRGYKIEYLGK